MIALKEHYYIVHARHISVFTPS